MQDISQNVVRHKTHLISDLASFLNKSFLTASQLKRATVKLRKEHLLSYTRTVFKQIKTFDTTVNQ